VPVHSLLHQRGFGLADVLVGVTVALAAALVIFTTFSESERVKRNIVSVGDAQVVGLLASFTLGLQLANAGNALATSAQALDACADPGDPDGVRNFAKSWRPVPVMIIDGGAPGIPDSFAIGYGTATTSFAPAPVVSASAGQYVVRSPNGFHPKVKGEENDLIVAIERAPSSGMGDCVAARVESVTDRSGSCDGCVQLSYKGSGLAVAHSVFNAGSTDDAQKVYYDVDAAKGVLRSTRLLDDQGRPSGAAPVPLASGIVNLKLQYGIDTDADGLVDTWASGTGPWAPDQLMSATAAKISSIKAIRIGVIVRSDQFDRTYDQDANWSMFDGTIAGTFPRSRTPPGNWRYRVYETTIPLRNAIWNRQT
jgi:type IV pilus assembly protein PilW